MLAAAVRLQPQRTLLARSRRSHCGCATYSTSLVLLGPQHTRLHCLCVCLCVLCLPLYRRWVDEKGNAKCEICEQPYGPPGRYTVPPAPLPMHFENMPLFTPM